MTPDQLTAAITDLARSVADIYSHLTDIVAQRQWPMPPFLPYEMPGYGTMLLPFQDVQPMVLPFQGVHPTALPFQGVQATAPVPIHQLRMLPSPSPTPSYVMASTMGPVFTMASAQPSMATTTVAPALTTGAVVLHDGPSLQHPFTDGIFYRGTGVQQIQDKGEKLQQIEQPTDITMEPARKMLTH
jgi:hypothetical protein